MEDTLGLPSETPPPTPQNATGQAAPTGTQGVLVPQPTFPAPLGPYLQTLVEEKGGRIPFDRVSVALLNVQLSQQEGLLKSLADQLADERERSAALQESLTLARVQAAVAETALESAETANSVKAVASIVGGALIGLAPFGYEKADNVGMYLCIGVGIALVASTLIGKKRKP